MHAIKGIRRLDQTTLRRGGYGDNWHTTWAADSRQYVGLCDGAGWADVEGYTRKRYNTRVYAISGDPPDITFEHLPGFPDLHIEEPPNLNRYYGFGILAVDDEIYNFLSTPNYIFDSPEARFVGVKLIYSSDNGQSWTNQDGSAVSWEPWAERSRENMIFFREPDDAFSLVTVLQMGQSYEHNRDGFVYLYAPNGNTEGTMNQLVQARVPRDRMLDRSSYEFFGGRDPGGSSEWVKDIDRRGIVHTFPSGWVNTKVHPYAWHPSVVYNAPLGLYMMVNWGMGCATDGMWFGKPSYLGFWVASAPEGPWTQIHEDTEWTPDGDANARAYQPQIVPKWISDDGRSFWLVWTDFQVIDGKRPHYAYNLQKVDVVT